MDQEQRHGVIGIGLFALGLVIVIVSLILLGPLFLGRSSAKLFTAVVAIVMYTLVFAPLAMGDVLSSLTGGRLVSLGMYWYAVAGYVALSLGTLYVANTTLVPPMGLLVVLQLLGLFGVMLAAYFGQGTQMHIENVEAQALPTLSSMEQLRSSAQRLSSTLLGIDDEHVSNSQAVAARVQQICDDVRYLAPMDDPGAMRLDQSIETNLWRMASLLGQGTVMGQDYNDLCAFMGDTERLLAQRKAMRY